MRCAISPANPPRRVTSQVYGLAIVDLYPNGIGLVDAIEDDPEMIHHILEMMRDWLVFETNNRGGTALTASPLSMATRLACGCVPCSRRAR